MADSRKEKASFPGDEAKVRIPVGWLRALPGWESRRPRVEP